MISADLLVDDDAGAWIELALARAAEGVQVIPVLTRPVDLSGTPPRRLSISPHHGRADRGVHDA